METKIEWRTDWENAPKEEEKILILIQQQDGPVITTGYFHWYTEDDYESFKKVAYWALQDLSLIHI